MALPSKFPLGSRPKFDKMSEDEQLAHPRALLVCIANPTLRRVVWADDTETIAKWTARGFALTQSNYDADVDKAMAQAMVRKARRRAAKEAETIVKVPSPEDLGVKAEPPGV